MRTLPLLACSVAAVLAACSSPTKPAEPDPTSPRCEATYPHGLHFAAPIAIGDAAIPAGSAANDVVIAPLLGSQSDIAVFFRAPAPHGSGIAVFGNRSGRFELSHTIELGAVVPYRGLAVDFDGDGRLDLATYALDPKEGVSLVVALATADGFAAPRTYAIAGEPLAGFMTIGTPIFAGSDTTSIHVATRDAATTRVRIYAVTHGGGVGAATTIPDLDARDVAGGDFDRNGVQDYAVVDANGRLAIYRANAGGTAAQQCEEELEPGDEPTQILVADLDGDHDDDVRTLQQSCFDGYDPDPCTPPGGGGGDDGGGDDDQGGPVVLFETQLDPTTRETLGDFNGDGVPDLAIGGPDSKISILLLARDGRVQREVSSEELGLSLEPTVKLDDFALAAGDLNGDGVADLVLGQRAAADSPLTGEPMPLVGVLIADGCVAPPGDDVVE